MDALQDMLNDVGGPVPGLGQADAVQVAYVGGQLAHGLGGVSDKVRGGGGKGGGRRGQFVDGGQLGLDFRHVAAVRACGVESFNRQRDP